jgi:hypothetical protein
MADMRYFEVISVPIISIIEIFIYLRAYPTAQRRITEKVREKEGKKTNVHASNGQK